MRSWWRVAIWCGFFASLGRADAQAPQGPPFRIAADLVRLDVLVVDAAGRPVTGLTSRHFRITEDRRPQTVAVFSPIRVREPALVTEREPLNPTDPQVGPAADGRRLVAIVMDDANMAFDPGVAKIAKVTARAAVDRMGPNDLAAVFYTFLGPNQPFTTDRQLLINAIESLVPHPGPLACKSRRGGCTVETLTRMGAAFPEGDLGRRLVMLVSSGTVTGPAEDQAIGSDMTDLSPRQEMFLALQSASVSVYGFDPAGLQTYASTAATIGRPSPGPARRTNYDLQVFTESTGGRAFIDMNDPWTRVNDVFQENSDYYLIGYHSTNANRDGRFRRVRVEVELPGVRVTTRRGYYAARENRVRP